MAALCSASSLMGYTLGATILRKTSFFIADNDTVDCSGGAFRVETGISCSNSSSCSCCNGRPISKSESKLRFVGWQIGEDEKIGEFRLSYPSISDGEETNMAQNGPFAVVVFYCDENEGFEQYEWFQDETSLWGYITLVVEDETSFEAVEFTLRGWNNGSITTVPGGQNMFALDHIALGGHGTGAHYAAETVKSTDYQVNGLFGLSFRWFTE